MCFFSPSRIPYLVRDHTFHISLHHSTKLDGQRHISINPHECRSSYVSETESFDIHPDHDPSVCFRISQDDEMFHIEAKISSGYTSAEWFLMFSHPVGNLVKY